MPTANVNLSPQQAKFIKDSIKRGRYQNVSEVMRAGLHLLSTQDRAERYKLERLRRLVKVGFDEIEAGKFTVVEHDEIDAFIASLRPRRKGRK